MGRRMAIMVVSSAQDRHCAVQPASDTTAEGTVIDAR